MTPHSLRTRIFVLSGLWLVTALFVVPTWGWTYWDFGDGNYLYVGRRILDGLVPYRDILAPQPPLHLLMSALSQGLGSVLFDSELIGARVYCLIVRLLGSLAVWLAALRIFRCDFRAAAAAAVFLALPIGFWWSLCLQSENLENVFLILAFWRVLGLDRRSLVAGGVCSALAMHCNMTAVPFFLCNLLFLGVRRPRLLAWYALPALGVWGAGAIAAWAWAGAPYLDNVVLNQVGSFPRTDILAEHPGGDNSFAEYAVRKVRQEGWKVLELEGPLILLGLGGMAVRWRETRVRTERDSDEHRRWEYAAWYCIGMLLSIGFVMKGGTVNYIFVLGEPAVAILAADAIVRLVRFAAGLAKDARRRTARSVAFGAIGVVAVAASLLWPPAIRNLSYTVRGVQSELPAGDYEVRIVKGDRQIGTMTMPGVLSVREIVERHTEPGDPILAPPFYAWISDRTVAAELAENYLWQIKWMNESFDMRHYGADEGEGVLKMAELAAMLRRREIPLVLLDTGQTGTVGAVRDAIANFYEPAEPGEIQTRNVRLEVYVPAGGR